MRRAVPFALCTLVSVALLGFALRTGVDALTAGPKDVDDFTGWQVDVTRWGLVGLAAVLGIAAAVVAGRRARALEGEGVLLGVPLLLGGLLLSALPDQGLRPALHEAASHTDQARSFAAEQARYVAEAKLHPVAVDFHRPAAPAALAALLPTAAELGTGWYDGQRPFATQSTVQGRTLTSTRLVQATRIPDGWNIDRWLRITVTDFSSPQAAMAWLQGLEHLNANTHYVPRWAGGVLMLVDDGGIPAGTSLTAHIQRGSRTWEVDLSDGQPGTRMTEAEKAAVLAVVARHVPAA